MKYGAQLARIFSTSFARQLINDAEKTYLIELQNEFPFIKEVLANQDYNLLYKNAFMLLANDYRNEYIYKTVFYTKMLETEEQ